MWVRLQPDRCPPAASQSRAHRDGGPAGTRIPVLGLKVELAARFVDDRNATVDAEAFHQPVHAGNAGPEQPSVTSAGPRTAPRSRRPCLLMWEGMHASAAGFGHLGTRRSLRAVCGSMEPPGRPAFFVLAGDPARPSLARRRLWHRRIERGHRGWLLACVGDRRRAVRGLPPDGAGQSRGTRNGASRQRDRTSAAC